MTARRIKPSVYVNPTDHTLSIGDSGLVEIHLQGIASIEPSDIVPAPTAAQIVIAGEFPELAATAEIDATIVSMTAADASFDFASSDGAQLPDESRTVRISDSGGSSDEPGTHSSEHTNDDATITMASGEPIELQHVQVTALTESNFVFEHTPVFNHGTGVTALNVDRTAPRLIEHGRTPESDVRTAPSHTPSESHSETGSLARSNHENHGRWNARHDDRRNDSDAHDHAIGRNSDGGGRHSNSGELNKHDNGHKHGGGALDFEPSSIAHEVFGAGSAGKFGLGDLFHFKSQNSGSEALDVMNIVDVDHTPASINHHGSGKGNSGPLATFEDLSPSNHHWSDYHGNSPDHERHGVSHMQHDLMV